MAPDIFAPLTPDDGHAQADHMSTSKTGDMVAVADALDAVHCGNRRLCVVPALVSRLRNGAVYPTPCTRLTRAECRVLAGVITDFGQFMPKITKARKLVDLLASSVCVY